MSVKMYYTALLVFVLILLSVVVDVSPYLRKWPNTYLSYCPLKVTRGIEITAHNVKTFFLS